ncbi:phosphate-starvation-inducible PsiE family protein [Intestinibacter sp.]
MNLKTKQRFIKVAHIFEVLLAVVILIVVFLGMFDILRVIYSAYVVDFKHPVDYDKLNYFLAQILLLVIAVELVIMLCLHKAETLLEVLLYAIARKLLLIPKSSGVGELFLGVLAIAAIFFIKKYLAPKKYEEKEDTNKFL